MTLKCYAHVVHHVKALRVTLTLSKCNNKAVSKLRKIEDVVDKLEESDIGRFRLKGVFMEQ